MDILLKSTYDGIPLHAVCIQCAVDRPKAVVQIVHGMAEHKERYFEFMNFLAEKGYVAVIHDQRGHGASVLSDSDLGYLYSGGWNALVEDCLTVRQWISAQYPGIPVVLMGHSMGSMVVRSFAKKYDDKLNGLIVCGSPSDNPAKGAGYLLACVISALCGERYRSALLNAMSFGSYNKNFVSEGENAWLSANRDNVRTYNDSKLCGYCFTANGFKALLGLMKDCYSPKGWKMSNPDMPILFISGAEDPCRINDKAFGDAVRFMKERGYRKVGSKLYPSLRHEILLEHNAHIIFNDIESFLNNL